MKNDAFEYFLKLSGEKRDYLMKLWEKTFYDYSKSRIKNIYFIESSKKKL